MRIIPKKHSDRAESFFVFEFSSVEEDYKPFLAKMKQFCEIFASKNFTRLVEKMETRCDDKYATDQVAVSFGLFADEMAELTEFFINPKVKSSSVTNHTKTRSDRKTTTRALSKLLCDTILSGKHWANEVTLDAGYRHNSRVDFMQFVPSNQMSVSGLEKGIFVCYEVKSCRADIYSGNGLNFIGEKNYLVMTMDCYKDFLPDIRSGAFREFLKKQHPDTSSNFGIMVPIPKYLSLEDEFENPTPFPNNEIDWKMAAVFPCNVGSRSRSMTELLFCMMRAGRSPICDK